MACKLSGRLMAALRNIAASSHLLLCCDFDGTISEIVARPEDARLLPGIKPLFERLSLSGEMQICLVSGRSLSDLKAISQVPQSVILVGSHGAESSLHCGPVISQEQTQLLTRLKATLHQSFLAVEGVQLEHKPYSVAVHVRRASRETATSVIAALRFGPGRWPGVISIAGKEVMELGVYQTNKGQAIEKLRTTIGAHYRVVYIGDDITDEYAFSVLAPSDLGIKVGDGPTHAKYQVASPEVVKQLLEILVKYRCQ